MDRVLDRNPDPRGFFAWARAARHPGEPNSQPAVEELLAEHHVMESVLDAMEQEAGRMKLGGAMRTEFWSGVIEFIGTFVHGCHRAKESEHFFPALVERGLIEDIQSAALVKEHETAADLTHSLCQRAEAGDWEGLMRLVSVYNYFMRPHMRREERDLIRPSLRKLEPQVEAELRASFDQVEDNALKKGRAYYLELARRLGADAGVTDRLGAPDEPGE